MVDIDKVKAARAGDEQSFAQLYEQFAPDLYKTALYTLGNAEDAQDVVSETFLEAYKGIGRLRDPEKFKPWIFKILSARCKRKIAEYVKGKGQLNIQDLENMLQTDVLLEEQLGERMAVWQALDALTPQERLIVVLTVLQGYTTKEIAQMLRLAQGTVSSKLFRTYKKLRTLLQPKP